MAYSIVPLFSNDKVVWVYGVYYDGTYVYVLVSTYIYYATFDGVTLGNWSSYTFPPNHQYTRWITGDGTYVYATNDSKIFVLKMIDGVLTYKTLLTIPNGNPVHSAYCDQNGYLHITGNNTWLYALKYNEGINTLSNITQISVNGYVNSAIKVTGDGTRLYVGGVTAGGKGLVILTFINNSYTIVRDVSTPSQTNGICCLDGKTFIGLSDNTIRAYDYNSNTISASLASENNLANNIVTDGYFLIVGWKNIGVKIYRYNNGILTPISSITGSLVGVGDYYHLLYYRFPYLFYTGDATHANGAKIKLEAQFLMDKNAGTAPLTVNFTAI